MSSEIVHPEMTFGDKLSFTPYAWAKMLYMRDRGNTEVAGYGVTGTEDPLLVTDFRLIKSECTGTSFDMDPDDGAEFMETMLDVGLMPWQYSNILIHTHPGNGPNPSGTDEKNFMKAFSHPNWAIMFIIAHGGNVYCRLKINIGPGVVKELKVIIDWSIPFGGSDVQRWGEEYESKVIEEKFRMTGKEGAASRGADSFPVSGHEDPDRWDEEFNLWATRGADLDRQIEEAGGGIDEIGSEITECHWDNNGDVAVWEDFEGVWYFYDPIGEKWFTEDLDDDDNGIRGIEPPDEPWVAKVVAWAEKYADERELAMVEESI